MLDEVTVPAPLSSNRDYRILWSGMFLSELAGEIAYIAFPLLVLAHDGPAGWVAAVAAVLAGARTIVSLPAGVLADRWDRKRIMLLSQGVRAVAMLGIAAALLFGDCPFWLILVVAAVEGAAAGVFQPAEHAALPQVVRADQLSEALARNAARPFAALLIGPALAGFTFGLHMVAPFSIDAGMLAVSFAALATLHLPRPTADRRSTTGPHPAAGRESLSGYGPLVRLAAVRTTLAWIAGVNLAFHALVILILVVSGDNAVAPGEIGLMMSCFGAGGLVGAVVAGRLHAALPAPVLVIGSSWIFVGTSVLMAFAPRGVPLGVLLGLAAVVMPVANATVLAYQLSVVPDRLRGRLTGLVGLCSELAATAGPVLAGLLAFGTRSGTASILAAAGLLGVVAVGATLSPTLRRLPASRPAYTGNEPDPAGEPATDADATRAQPEGYVSGRSGPAAAEPEVIGLTPSTREEPVAEATVTRRGRRCDREDDRRDSGALPVDRGPAVPPGEPGVRARAAPPAT